MADKPNTFIQIHEKDNVLIALVDLPAESTIDFRGKSIKLQQEIQAKHKFTIEQLSKDDVIYMYGTVVGRTKIELPQGSLLTTQNTIHEAAYYGKKTENYQWNPPSISRFQNRTFMGYHREDGQVGTANYWLIIPLVFCENRNVEVIKDAFNEALGYGKTNPFKSMVKNMVKLHQEGRQDEIVNLSVEKAKEMESQTLFPNLDGIKVLDHQGGCGGTRRDSESLCALLAGYINNPNVAGATVLSLGCQNAQPSILKQKLHKINPELKKPVIILEQQEEGTEQQLLSEAIKKTFLGMVEANKQERKPAPLSKITLGLECGGSDGFSGISANPSVGYASDLIVALGGTTMLSEFPELCGVEQELINRCATDESADKFSELMKAYAASAIAVGSGFDMNPSPGNIKDGLITDAIKSAGAAKKGGTSPVIDVLDYAEYFQKSGLNLVCTPGNDVESTTAMAGSGANIMVFTTGLGTPTGNPIAPIIKIATNTKLAKRMPDIIDIDTGGIISGEKSIPQMGEEILEMIIKVASGEVKPKAVLLGQDDFIPWKRGVSL
ncbi:altronate dehydratase family protein [Aquiflexum sp. TKW24L]|uniref:UxaA family hydrolase n=1 Tax=Aquiflexum sp. TKW24L TaxID=2942212 RepID=UPI0020C13AB5|nr:altronate dehydratase family protein [Aquiflexum sp. TKW24L]MCL6258796.1 altronate dehydratase family protein [Aquiflexum sp. TKW24L]